MTDKETFRGARAMINILSRKKSNSDPNINVNKSSKPNPAAEVNGEAGKCCPCNIFSPVPYVDRYCMTFVSFIHNDRLLGIGKADVAQAGICCGVDKVSRALGFF